MENTRDFYSRNKGSIPLRSTNFKIEMVRPVQPYTIYGIKMHMRGGFFTTDETDWIRVFLILPKKIDGKWLFWEPVYRKTIYNTYYDGGHGHHKYKTVKQFVADELGGKND